MYTSYTLKYDRRVTSLNYSLRSRHTSTLSADAERKKPCQRSDGGYRLGEVRLCQCQNIDLDMLYCLHTHTHARTHARTHTHGQRHTWFYYDTRYSWMSDRLLLNSPSGIYKTPLSVYLWVICSLSASWCLQKWLLLVKQIYSMKYCGCNRTKLDPQINCGCEEKCRMWQGFWLFVLQEIHMLQKTNLINFIRVQTDISLYK